MLFNGREAVLNAAPVETNVGARELRKRLELDRQGDLNDGWVLELNGSRHRPMPQTAPLCPVLSL
jgi:hypothetical protein